MTDKKRIGEVLIDAGLISVASRDKALEIQERSDPHRLLGHILVELKAINYGTLLVVLSEVMHIPKAEALLADRNALKVSLGLIPEEEPEEKPELKETTTDNISVETGDQKAEIEPEQSKQAKPTRGEEPVKKPKAKLEKITLQLSKIELPLINLDSLGFLPDSKGDLQQIIVMCVEMLNDSEFEEAGLLLEEGLAGFQTSLHLKWLQIWAHCAQKHMQKARKLVDNFDIVDFQNPAVAALNSFILLDSGRFADAIPFLVQITTLKKADTIWYFWLGYALAHLNQGTEATIYYNKYLKASKTENKYTRFARKQMQELAS